MASGFLKSRGHFFDGPICLIEEMIEDYGYEIFPVPGLNRFAEGYVGLRGKRIFVDEDTQLKHPFRYRFTLAEELSHIVILKRDYPAVSADELKAKIDAYLSASYNAFETDAKCLARALLMPQPLFQQRFLAARQLFSGQTLSRPRLLYQVIKHLSQEFQVSRQPIGYRAKSLGLLTEADLSGG